MTTASPNAENVKETPIYLRWFQSKIISLLLVFLAIWVPRVLALDRYVTADEPFWLTRSANFSCALSQGTFAHTYQSEHPGVTVMWAGAAGFFWQSPDYHINCSNLDIGELELRLQELGYQPITLIAAGRFFVVLAIAILLTLAYTFARRLLGPLPAFTGFLFIAFDPFYTAHTRVLHLDGTLSTLMLLALLALLCYLRDRRLSDLIVSGITAGLSWLTKSPGFFLIPFAGLLAILDFAEQSYKTKKRPTLISTWKQLLWPMLIWGLIGTASFLVFWPAIWADPLGILTRIIDAARNYAEDAYGTSRVFFNGVIVDNGELGWEFYYFYPLNYLWRSTPVILMGLFSAGVAFFLPHRETGSGKVHWTESRRVLIATALYTILFTIAMTIGTKKFDRYQLPAYPALDLIAAVGWVEAAKYGGRWLTQALSKHQEKPNITFLRSIPVIIIALAMIAQLIGTLRTYPYYFSYYNPWMGGPDKAMEVMLIGRGEGIEQAAHYLNQQPNAEQLTARSWYNRGSFSYFFKGTSESLPSGYQWSKEQVEDVLNVDYVVIYVHQWQRKMPERFLDYLAPQQPVFSFSSNGIEYVRVYKIEPDEALYAAPTYTEIQAKLEDKILLEGYSVPKRQLSSGETLHIALSWQAIEAPEERLKVFIHVLNSAGALVAQSDAEPVFWLRPTDSWEKGERIVDRYFIPLPGELPTGEYTLRVGMYRASGERLSITRGGEGDVFNLGKITVQP